MFTNDFPPSPDFAIARQNYTEAISAAAKGDNIFV